MGPRRSLGVVGGDPEGEAAGHEACGEVRRCTDRRQRREAGRAEQRVHLAIERRAGGPVHFAFLGLVVMNLVGGFQALGTLLAVGLMLLPAITARFWALDLTGLMPAPRNVPQIEVTFDIDANGIVHVSATDKGTGKEQSMTITGGTSLSKEDIDRMVKDAEANAEADKKRREAQDLRNTAENSAYQIEKLLKDNEDKLPEDVKSEVQSDVDELKKALEGEDDDAVKSTFEKLQSSQTKLGEAIYAQAQAGEGAADAGAANADANEDDVVDAEVVDDEDEKK